MHLCWVLLQTRGVVDLASLFSTTAFYTAMFHMHINEPWLIAFPPIHYIWKCVESHAKINDQHLRICSYICSFIILAWTFGEISSPHYHSPGQHLVCAICDVMRCSIQSLISISCKWMRVNGKALHCVQFIKSRVFLLQVMWESISVLWVMQESISGTASHATTLASYPGRVGANWLHAEWVAPPLAA